MSLLVVALLVAVVGVAAGGIALARGSKRSFDAQNVIVEGVDTGAPAEWAGAHTPEARLHRRIRDAVRALQANAALSGGLAEARVRLEAEAVEIDRRLVAAAALPESVRAEPLAKVEAAVVALEQAAADAALGAQLTEEDVIGDTADAITERLTAVAEARAALDEIETRPAHEAAEDAIADDEPGASPGSAGL